MRDFRVLDQHYRLVSDAVRLVVGETPRISVLLPDNPESHARRNCTFSQRTDAVAFIDAALAGVHDYIEMRRNPWFRARTAPPFPSNWWDEPRVRTAEASCRRGRRTAPRSADTALSP